MTGVVSATDYFTRLALGDDAFEEMVSSRSPHVVYRGSGLETRDGRRHIEYGDVVRRDHAAVAAYPDEFEGVPVGNLWPDPVPSEPVTATRSAPAATSFPWTVTLSLEPSRRYRIRLLDSVAARLIRQARMDGTVETGGYLWSRDLPGRHSATVSWSNGAGGTQGTGRRRWRSQPRRSSAPR